MILDEVQTGVGRTGHLYAHEAYGVTPDILTTAKALGCGFPIAATLARAEVAEALEFGTHGSTFGGNRLAWAVAAGACGIINTPEVLSGVKERRRWIEEGLQRIAEKTECAFKVRGQGLLIGWVLAPDWEGRAREIMKAAQAAGVFVLVAGPNVVRFAPSLVIPKEDIEEGLERLEQAVIGLAAESGMAAAR